MADIHNDRFVINDIALEVPPTKIGIGRVALNKQWKTLRTRQSMKAKSGHSNLTVQIEVVFVGLDQINQKLRPLLAQFRLTPFCYVENEHLRNTVLGPESEGVNMALALQNLTVSSVPQSPETMIARFSFIWFNYRPFTPKFYFKEDPFIPQPQMVPGKAFKLFYTPELDNHVFVRKGDNQRLELSYPQFTVDQGQVVEKTADKFKLSEVLDEQQKMTFNELFGEFENTVNYIRVAHDTGGNLPTVDGERLQKLESAMARWRLIQSDPTSANAAELLAINATITEVTSAYQDVAKKRQTDQAALRQLLKLKDEVNRRSEEAISKPGGWLPFFKDPIVETQVKPINATQAPSVTQQLYYRVKQLFLNKGLGDEIVVTDLNAGFSHHLAVLPVLSYQYPTCQYLGTSDIQVQLSLKVTSDAALRILTEMYNGLSSNAITGKFIPAQYVSLVVRNPIVNLVGGKEMTMDDMIVNTIPGSPGTYDVQITFSDAGIKPGDLETLNVDRVTDRNVRDAIWKAILSNIVVTGLRRVRAGGDVSFGNGRIEAKMLANVIDEDGMDDSSEQFLRGLLERGLLATGDFSTNPNDALAQRLGDLYEKAYDDNDTFTKSLSVRAGEAPAPDELSRILYDMLVTQKGNQESIDELFSNNDFQTAREMLVQEAAEEQRGASTHKKKLEEAIRLVRRIVYLEQRNRPAFDYTTGDFTDPDTGETINITSLFDKELSESFERERQAALSQREVLRKANVSLPNAAPELDGALANEAAFRHILLEIDRDNVSIEATGTSRQKAMNEIFLEWNKYAVQLADVIINSGRLDLQMFREAKFLQSQQVTGTRNDGYPDFKMDEVSALLQTHYAGIDLPSRLVLEPDFYFFNETADADLGNLISAEQMQDIRIFSKAFARNTLDFGTSYYQEQYLKNVDPSFREFIKKSVASSRNGGAAGRISSPDYSDSGVAPQASLLKKEKVKSSYFASNQLSFRDTMLDGKNILANFTDGVDGESKPVHNLSHFTNVEQFLSGGTTLSSLTPQEIAAFGVWVNPLPDGIITSAPGMRLHPVDNVMKLHRGTDLAIPHQDSTGFRVIASCGGTVHKVQFDNEFNGNRVTIRTVHQGSVVYHTYLHLNSIEPGISEGRVVETAQLLGACGNTGKSKGAHLHFEVLFNGAPAYLFTDTDKLPDPSIQSIPLISMTGRAPVQVGPVAGHKVGESILDKSLASMLAMHNRNAGYRMNRAYPTFHMRFIEDDSDETMFQFDDFFSYSAIQNIQVIRDREVAADLAMITMTNISGLLSNRKWQGTFQEREPLDAQGKRTQEPSDDPLKIDTAEENPIASFLLQEGTKVELRLGYTNDVDKLDIVMVGKITAIEFNETDDLITIVVQSHAMELVQDMKGVDKVQTEDGFFYSNARTADLLTEMISQPECVSFGKWKRGDAVLNTNRNLLTNRWEWNPAPQTDNIFAPDSTNLDVAPLGIIENMTYHIYRTTVWDIFKEMELRHPDYVASPVPYVEADGRRIRMTMFFGLPDQLYFAGDPSTSSNKKNVDIKEAKKQLNDAIKDFNADKFSALMEQLTDPSITTAEDVKGIDFARRFLQRIGDNRLLSSLPGENKSQHYARTLMENFADRLQKKQAIDEGSIQAFRKYHILTTRQHIISNNISASSSNSFNAVTIQYVDDGDLDDEINITPDGLEPQDPETMTIKLDARIPDEEVRENFVVYPNCQGDDMAKRYCVSLLTQGAKYMYKGDITILGNPGIKPYDICYVFDEYNDMIGPIEVRRVEHFFSYDEGFVTRIVPDLVANASEGTTLTANEALGLMAEAIVGREDILNVSLNPTLGVHTGRSITSNLLYGASIATGKLVGFFGAKKLIYLNQFGNPVRLTPLLHHGRPMVAGVAPDKLQNVYSINSAAQWVRTGIKGLSESSEEFFDRFTFGQNNNLLFNPRGEADGGTTVGAFRKP